MKMQADSKLPPIIIFGDGFQCGSYLLQIQLNEDVALRFGRFRKGKSIELPAGEYSYVGSALSKNDSTSLARRLVRHATRTGEKPPHRIRAAMIDCFARVGLKPQNPLPKSGKKLFWNVDHLLDLLSAEIVNAFVIRSDQRLEAALGQFMENDPHTHVIEKGLGANDVSGNTHILRVEADGTWWHKLSHRLQTSVFLNTVHQS